jgi:hypothetical protein
MNVHLLRSPELSEETYRNVLQLLQNFQGPMHFIPCEEELIEDTISTKERIWNKKEDFERLEINSFSAQESRSSSGFKIRFPYLEKVKSWNQLFTECDNYRKTKEISENDLVVLLTDIGNELNWFGGVDPNMKNYFIQTSNWEHFFGNTIDIRFPIAYEIIIWAMRYFMFENNGAILKGVHKKSIGCIMDFCEDKSQIIIKMRTADVCDTCMNHFKDRDTPTLYTRQFFEILDGIRNSMTFRNRSSLLQQPSRLEIRGHSRKIFFTDLGGLELRLNPKEKSIYLFYLNHPEGIIISHLQDYKEEITQLYSRFSNQSEPETINRAIETLINPLDNDINVVLSRINGKIKKAVGESLYEYYCISGERGDRKKISLDRELINNNLD